MTSRRPSHRRFDLQWTPAPRSAYARARRSPAIARSLAEPYRTEMLALVREIQDGHERMLGYRERRVLKADLIIFSSPTAPPRGRRR